MSTPASAKADAAYAKDADENRPLASHIYCAFHGRDLIMLDVRSGHYDLIAGLGASVVLTSDRRHLRSNDASLMNRLDGFGLFATAASDDVRLSPPFPTQSALAHPPPRVRLEDLAWMGGGWVDMLVWYHGRAFSHLLRNARRRDQRPFCSDLNDIGRQAAVFDRLSIWLPFQGDCLYRCFLLLRLLGSQAREVDWVFGVRTWPFYAHCWLQHGDTCLTDFPDRLESFVPIMTA